MRKQRKDGLSHIVVDVFGDGSGLFNFARKKTVVGTSNLTIREHVNFG